MSPEGAAQAGPERRLQDLGILLPSAPHPLGAYVEAVQSGALLFLSGMLPIRDGRPQYVGRLGAELDTDAGQAALRTATLNGLSVVKLHLGSLDRVTRVISVRVYLAVSGDADVNQPLIADAASELLRQIFGEDKMSVRSVIGVAGLPLGLPVMVELTFEVSN